MNVHYLLVHLQKKDKAKKYEKLRFENREWNSTHTITCNLSKQLLYDSTL